jgi:hypothetical protein
VIPSPQGSPIFSWPGRSRSLVITNSGGASMLFSTSHYRLTAQVDRPTILKRPSLRVTSKFQSQLHPTSPEASALQGFFPGAL